MAATASTLLIQAFAVGANVVKVKFTYDSTV
jgi:hypothetical protein